MIVANGKKIKYSIDIDFTTGSAEKSVKAATDKIKEHLQSIAVESNKTKYFEGLIQTVRDVDEQLANLKTKHGDGFDTIYEGVGKSAKQEFELVTEYARSEINKFYEEIKGQQSEITRLQNVQNDYSKYSKSAQQAINDKNISVFGQTMKSSQVREMYNAFDGLLDKKAQFEKTGDTSSVEYLENYVNILKTASGLIKADQLATDGGEVGVDPEKLYTMAEKARSVLNSLDIESIYKPMQDIMSSLTENLAAQQRLFADSMPSRIKDMFGSVGGGRDDEIEREISLYDKLQQKVQEYFDLAQKRSAVKYGTTEYNALTVEIDKVVSGLEKIKSLDAAGMQGFHGVLNDIEDGEITSVEDALTRICEILKVEIPSMTTNQNSFGKMVDEAEYIQGLMLQLEKLFGNINTMSRTIEYKVLINGQEVDIMQGGHKEISEQTRVESYLGTLGKKRYVSAHNHPGGTSSQYDKYDFKATINDVYNGIAAMGMNIGENDITTLDLAKVKLEDALAVLEQIEKLNVTSVSSDKINEMFRAINPAYGDVAKTWQPSQMQDLAQYIYQVGESANLSVDPLEQFQNILKAVTDGKIDLSKYQQLLDGFKPEDAKAIFNEIMSAEGKQLQVQDVNTSSLSEFVNTVKHQQEALVQLRNEADVTYSDIHNMVKSYLSDSTGDANNFIKQYFGRNEQGIISDWLIELENGQSSVEQITNRIAGYFQQIDPSEYLTSAKAQIQDFFSLTDEIGKKSFSLYDSQENVEIGKYTERLDVAKQALDALGDQGLITAEELKAVQAAYDESKSRLNAYTTNYNGYGDYEYTYEDEFMSAKNENERLRHDLELTEKELADLKQIKAAEQEQVNKNKTNTYDGTDNNKEITDLEKLQSKLIEVRQAIEAKTEAFVNEGTTVEQVVNEEIAALMRLNTTIEQVLNNVGLIKEGFGQMNTNVSDGVPANTPNASDVEPAQASPSVGTYALDATVNETNSILNNILAKLGDGSSLSGLLEPFNDAVTELKNVANGIVEHQKAQQADKSAASARIANNYGQLSSISMNAVSSLGDEAQIKQMKALANDVVRVEGAVRDADGAWKGFIVDINESNNAVIHAISEHSAFAETLNKAAEATKKAGDASKEAGNQDAFAKSLSAQKSAFDEYRKSLSNVDYLNDEVREGLNRLGVELHAVSDTKELDNWKNSFTSLKDEITVVQEVFGKLELEKLKQFRGTLNSEFKTLDFTTTTQDPTDKQKEILDLRKQLIALLEKYEIGVKNGKQVELSAINETMAALRQKINVYRQENDLVNSGGQKYGATAVLNATAKYNSLQQVASGEFANSSVVQTMFQQYEASYNRLLAKRRELAQVEGQLNDTQKAEFKQLQTECSNYAREIDKVVKSSQKLAASGIGKTLLGDDFTDSIDGRKSALKDFVQETYGVSVATDSFKNNFNECTFAVKNGDGTFTQMTATINEARTAIVATAGDTKKVTTAWEAFVNMFKGKFKSIFAYFVSSFSIYRVWQQIRNGVTYVKEIDSALTELKKVTNETDAAYDQFLQDMSKTAGVVGSTVKDLTTMAAEWGRLGYSMEEAGQLAKSTAVLLNVSEFEDATSASEALISTMQAFQYTADESRHVVDILNEVGEFIARR